MDHWRSRMLLFFLLIYLFFLLIETRKRFKDIPMKVRCCGLVLHAPLHCTLLPGGNGKFAWLTPSSWTAGGSHWTGGGTQAWWGTWALNRKCSSSACPPPGAHRASPATWTERSAGISAKEKPRYRCSSGDARDAPQHRGGKTSLTFPSKWIFLLRWMSSSILFIDCTLELHSLMIWEDMRRHHYYCCASPVVMLTRLL